MRIEAALADVKIVRKSYFTLHCHDRASLLLRLNPCNRSRALSFGISMR